MRAIQEYILSIKKNNMNWSHSFGEIDEHTSNKIHTHRIENHLLFLNSVNKHFKIIVIEYTIRRSPDYNYNFNI